MFSPFGGKPLRAFYKKKDESRFYVFFDSSQGVFGSGDEHTSFVAENVLPIKPPYFPLVHNYRTTREISDFSRAFRTGKEILNSHSSRLGYIPEIITYKDAAECRKLVSELAKKLFYEEGLRADEVHLLSARKPFGKGSVFEERGDIDGFDILDLGLRKAKHLPKIDELNGKIVASTIAGFKGLETSVGIVVNLSEYNLPLTNPIMSSLFYVAATRAKHMLYIFVKEDDGKAAILKSALEKIGSSIGPLVIESGHKTGEYAGTVVHYNPERVGWLKVSGGDFERSNIMFFPHDVEKAALKDIKVGTSIRFRPKVEGYVTIACDLKFA